MTQEDLQSQFDRWAADYDAAVREDGIFPFDGYDRLLGRVLELAVPLAGRSVLELGVGTGNLTAQLVAGGAAVWGLDFSAEMLKRARQRAPAATLGQVDLLQSYPAAFRRPFDRIVSTYVFHEFPLHEKAALLQRLFDGYLAPGGRVVIGDIGFPDAAARATVRQAAGDRWEDEYFWLRDETESALAKAGLAADWSQISSCGFVLTIVRLA